MSRPHHGYPEPADHVTQSDTVPLPVAAPPTLLERLGGWWGVIGTGAPQVLFAVLTNLTSLAVTAGSALALAVALAVVRMRRGEAITTALGGVLGVGLAAGIALWTGSASDFFLVGIVTSGVLGLGTVATLLVRRPLTGLTWNALHGGGHPWRDDQPSRRAHDLATGALAVMFGARFAVSGWLYSVDSTNGLALARVGLGLPLTVVTTAIAFWAFRRTTHRLLTPARVAAQRAHRAP